MARTDEDTWDLATGVGATATAVAAARALATRAGLIEDPLAEFILNTNPAEGAVLEAVMNESKDGLDITLAETEVNTDVEE